MSASITNPDSAQQAQAALLKQTRPGIDPRSGGLEAAATREHVETADPDGLDIEVDGETIPCEAVGVGERFRPLKKAATAEERGDDLLAAEAILDMIDVLVRVSGDGYGEAFWDGLTQPQLREAFRALGERSAGGNE